MPFFSLLISKTTKPKEFKVGIEDKIKLENLLESLDFFNRVRSGYLEIADSNPDRIIVLDAELSVEDLQDKIFNEVKNRLNASLG